MSNRHGRSNYDSDRSRRGRRDRRPAEDDLESTLAPGQIGDSDRLGEPSRRREPPDRLDSDDLDATMISRPSRGGGDQLNDDDEFDATIVGGAPRGVRPTDDDFDATMVGGGRPASPAGSPRPGGDHDDFDATFVGRPDVRDSLDDDDDLEATLISDPKPRPRRDPPRREPPRRDPPRRNPPVGREPARRDSVRRDSGRRRAQEPPTGDFDIDHGPAAGWIGDTVDGCRIESVLGQGGMGVVYKGRQESLDRVVAVKALSTSFHGDDSVRVERFKIEARTLATFSSPHIIQVHGVGVHRGVPYLMLEFASGGSLTALAARERGGRLPSGDAARWLLQAARGLQSAASRGVIHRDIKPDNLLLDREGNLKIADFGIAKAIDRDRDLSLTLEGHSVGTITYMSPEQFRGEELDERSDMWSLGASFYHLLTGKMPVPLGSLDTVARARAGLRFLDPATQVRDGSLDAIGPVIRKMTQRDRDQRYRDFGQLIEHLMRLRTGPEGGWLSRFMGGLFGRR